MTYIRWFDGTQKDDIALTGGKGANLGEMVRAGLPVPPGFIITTQAYRAFVQANDLQPRILELARAADPASPEAASQSIRQLFDQGTIPQPITDAILGAYHSLSMQSSASSDHPLSESAYPLRQRRSADSLSAYPLASVAVRSSATAEDLPSASFAGQQETYLNIQGDEALLEAVKNCWSSLWTPRAMAYRARNNIAPDDVALAVVVQAMAPADPSTSSGQDPSTGSGQAAAGILFTANPTTGARDEVVINAAWGLGEAIVGGQVTPDTIIADKETGTVKQIDVGEKTVMTVPVAGGTAELPVADSLKKARVLSDAQIAELVRLGCEIERHYGAPQDIEWCRAGDRFFIVQTRPITALPPTAGEPDVPGDDDWPVMEKKPAQPFDLWTQSNVGEVWPNPVSPLLWSAITFTLNQSTRFTLQDLHAPYLDDVQITNRFYGRIYYNEGALAYIFNREFGLPGSFLDAAFGTRSSADVRQSGGFHLLRFLRRLPTFLRMTVGRMGTDRELEALFPQVDRWVADFVARNPDERIDNELWEELSTVWVPRSSQVMNLHTAVSASAFATFSMLERLLDRWTGRPELAQDLVTGLSGVYTAEIGAALWEMACELRALGLADLVLDSSPADALAQLQKLPEARPVIDRLDAFLQQHGHRCANEAEWLNPRWAEEPAQVIEMVAGYLRAGDEINPVEAEQRQRRRREGAVVWVEGRLDPLRRAIFRRVLEKAQHLTRLRDNGKHYSMKAGFPFVQVYRVIGRRWTERGWLRQPDDIFFMTVPDLERIVEAGDPASAGLDLHKLVAERRKAYEYWFDVEAPEVIGPDGRTLDRPAAKPSAEFVVGASAPEQRTEVRTTTDLVLRGIAASGGQARGPARIIRSPGEMHQLQQGDILVTRATDPGWTPVFPIVGGLVLEVGGQLSHGAIVAREYGVPAVVNVDNAMRRITDGQEIAVDGSAGCVYLDSSQRGHYDPGSGFETDDVVAS